MDQILDCHKTKCFRVQYKATTIKVRDSCTSHLDMPSLPKYFKARLTAQETSP
jgi:hypothetical protein